MREAIEERVQQALESEGVKRLLEMRLEKDRKRIEEQVGLQSVRLTGGWTFLTIQYTTVCYGCCGCFHWPPLQRGSLYTAGRLPGLPFSALNDPIRYSQAAWKPK